jgi:hypothetical protein
MDMKKEIEAALAQPVRSPEDAERVGRLADVLAELLRLETRASRELGHQADNGVPEASDLRGKTLHDAAERVLEDAGVPLHVHELGARIKARGWTHPRSPNPRPDQIFFQLAARLPRHPDRFRRVAPNTFGLAHWQEGGERPNRRRPRASLFRGPGRAIGRESGSSEEIVSGKESAWRSS